MSTPHPSRRRHGALAALLASLLMSSPTLAATAWQAQLAQSPPPAATAAAAPKPGVPFSADQVAVLLPATVYFQGKSAPVQLRNAAAIVLSGGATLWVALVDSSGYSSSVQQRYQFYFVTEGPLQVGNARLPTGVYGGGFVGAHFLFMDVGGHTVAQGPIQTDPGLHRPRPLQLIPESPSAVKLYLGRRLVTLQPASAPGKIADSPQQ